MFIEIHAPNFSDMVLTAASLLLVFGHNLWLIAKKHPPKIRLEINTSDVFPESDSAVNPKRVKDFRIVTRDDFAPIGNFRVEGDSLVADVESSENFYAALELAAHPITLGAEKFAGYVRHEDAQEWVAPDFAGGTPTAPQRESYAKFAKVFCAVAETGESFNLAVGHRFEIVPRTAWRDGKLTVRVTFEGEPMAGLRVSSGGEEINGGKYLAHARTDADGLAELKTEGSGHWFVRTHYIRRHSDADNFEWESFWASLTFRL